MSLWRSIELRLTAWYAVMLFAGFLVLGAVLWIAVRYAVRAAIDDRLQERIERLVSIASMEVEDEEPDNIEDEVEEELVEYVAALPEGHLTQIRDEDGRQLFPPGGNETTRIPWRQGGRDRHLYTTRMESVPYRVLVQEVFVADRPYAILLASSLEVLRDIRDRILASLLVVTPIALVLCCGGGFYIARRALKPVNEITEAASSITLGNLERRIASRNTGDALDRLAKTFNAMLERIESSVARLEQFSADASHELRTPLAVIRTTSELALRHSRTEEGYRSDLKDIQTEAERLSELVEVLLALSRDGGERQVPMTDVDLTEIVTEVCHTFERGATAKGLSLECQIPGEAVLVNGNEPSLRRMLASLLENALAHTQDGSISVSLVPELRLVRLSVKDTGEGIPEDALGRIFDRFYRADTSRGRAGGHAGLGLSIVKRIADLHEAELTVESRPGEGAEFTVRFPRAEAS